MKEYLKRENPGAPLCIGVFGPPGSGKSFGVVQLANSIDKKKVKKIEFNVSQFESTDDLIDAFHKVRDEVLKKVRYHWYSLMNLTVHLKVSN